MNRELAESLARSFRDRFGREPQLFRAPGRINLIGEHTDYNDGFVLPAAIDLATYVAIAPRQDLRLRASSLRFDQALDCDLRDLPARGGDWRDYVVGVVRTLLDVGHDPRGADMLVDGDLPMGAGLSASAALEVGVGLALSTIAGVALDRTDLALLCQRAENDFVGARCGVMDQFISCRGLEGAALLLDCRSLEAKAVAIDPAVRLVVCDTMARHQIADGDYNLRRRECESAVELLKVALPQISALRDVDDRRLTDHASLLSPVLLRRARHVVGENTRTLRAAAALQAGDLALCGKLMNASHESLRDDFEVSCEELDIMVEAARKAPGALGARMMGGGFGGCTINLVEGDRAEAFMSCVGAAFRAVTGVAPNIFCCAPAAGAGPVAL